MKINVLDSFSRAFKHTENFLFKPFQLKKWLTLGFITLFTFSGGYSFNFNYPGNWERNDTQTHKAFQSGDWTVLKNKIMHFLNSADANTVITIAALIIVCTLLFFLVFMWLNSVFNFVLVDNIIKNKAAVREPFARLKPKGKSLFLWNISVLIIFLLLFALFLSLIVYGIYDYHKTHGAINILWMVLGGISLIIAGLFAGIIGLITTDFIIPVMYAEDIKILHAWKNFMPSVKGNLVNLLVYVALKIVIGIGQTVLSIFAVLASLIIIGIPSVLIFAVCALAALALKMTMSAFAVIIISIFVCVILSAFIYLINTMLMPVEIFRRVFAIDLLGQFNEKWNLLKTLAPPACTNVSSPSQTA